MDKAAAGCGLIPVAKVKLVGVYFLAHPAARRQAHAETGRVQIKMSIICLGYLLAPGPVFLKSLAFHGTDFDLEAAHVFGPCDLALGGVALPKGHGHELADNAFFDTVAVEPRLGGHHQVILGILRQTVGPGFAGDGIDFAGGHLDGKRILCAVRRDMFRVQIDPHGLGLKHGQHDAAVLDPFFRHLVGKVIHMFQGEGSKANSCKTVLKAIEIAISKGKI